MRIPDRELDKSPIEQAITAIAITVATNSKLAQMTTGPAIDLTYLLSSGADKPAFTGMRMGGYTAQNQTLFFEAAVPEKFNRSTQADNYATAVLQDAISNAIDFFQQQDVSFDAIYWQGLATTMAAALEQN